MKKLQVALDLNSTEQAIKILDDIVEYVDIIELGTPLMINEGKSVIKEIKKRYPEKIIFADIKIMDGAKIMSDIVFKAGADMVSVLGAANDTTIQEVIDNAKKYNAKVLVDMCAVKDLQQRAQKVSEWNPDYICVHVGFDIQDTGADPVEEIRKIQDINCKKAAAGGINLLNFESACQSDIDVIIVGGGIYNSNNPKETAKKMYEIINNYR